MVFFREYRADILSSLYAGGHWWATQVAKHVSDQGNQHNNGPHQDQIFGICSPLGNAGKKSPAFWCVLLFGGTDAPSRLFMKGVRLFVAPFFSRPIYSV